MGWSGRDERGGAAATVGAACATALIAAACGRTPASAPAPPRPGGEAGFLAPPSLAEAEWTAVGGVRLVGRAPPDAIVRLQSPDGRALGVTADAAGAWSADLPATPAPGLFALTAQVGGGRTLRGEGALATAPPGSAAPALVARAGAASVVPGSGPAPASPVLQVIDFDRGGGIAAAGRAAPGATLKLRVDGAEVGGGRADGAGRFGMIGVAAPLAPGPHRLRVEAPQGAAEAGVDTAAGPAPGAAPFRAVRAANGWRVDWTPPGGGVQSLLLLDAAAAGARP